MIIAPATVVPPDRPAALDQPKSRRLILTACSSSESCSSSSGANPSFATPSSTAAIAGTAAAFRTSASIRRASSRLMGRGRPCVITADSSATMGRPSASALRTSGWICSQLESGSVTRRMPSFTCAVPFFAWSARCSLNVFSRDQREGVRSVSISNCDRVSWSRSGRSKLPGSSLWAASTRPRRSISLRRSRSSSSWH